MGTTPTPTPPVKVDDQFVADNVDYKKLAAVMAKMPPQQLEQIQQSCTQSKVSKVGLDGLINTADVGGGALIGSYLGPVGTGIGAAVGLGLGIYSAHLANELVVQDCVENTVVGQNLPAVLKTPAAKTR